MSSFVSATDAARRVRYRRRQEEKRQQDQQQQPLLRSSSASPTLMMTSSILLHHNSSSPPTSPTHQQRPLSSWRSGQQQQQPQPPAQQQSGPPQMQINTSTSTTNNNNGRRNRLPAIVSPTSPSRSWDEGDSRPPSPGGGGRGWTTRHNTISSMNRSSNINGNSSHHHQQHQPQQFPISMSQGSIFRRVKSSPGEVESAAASLLLATAAAADAADGGSSSNADEDDIIVAGSSSERMDRSGGNGGGDNESIASSRRSSSGDAMDEIFTMENPTSSTGGSASTSPTTGTTTTTTAHNNNNHHHAARKTSISPMSWDSRLAQVQEKALLQQRDNSRSLIAIQQLLANVQAERDIALNKLDVLRQQQAERSESPRSDSPLHQPPPHHAASSSSSRAGSPLLPSPSDNNSPAAAEDAANKVKALTERLAAMENELRAVAPHSRLLLPQQQQQQPDGTPPGATTEKDWKHKEIVEIAGAATAAAEEDGGVVRQTGSECDSIETSPSLVSTTNSSQHIIQSDNDALRKELHEKITALENAKMIIASLEKSSDRQTTDLKTKIRQKDQEISRLKKDVMDSKKTLDALAVELRDVQRGTTASTSVCTQAESIKRVQLASRLEANLADVRAAAVILESTQDPAAVGELSDLLQDSAHTLRDGIAAIEHGVADDPHGRSFNLWRELEEKKKAIKNLEQSLIRQEENFRYLRKEREASQAKLEHDNDALHTEVRILRQQCITNMEVLTKKERELVVLRDSLKVEDDVGYISDDEEEETEDDGQMSASTTTNMMLKSEYGHSQTEALATLLAAGGNRSFDSNGVAQVAAAAVSSSSQGGNNNNSATIIDEEQITRQLAALKSELAKSRTESEKTKRQLQVEKESLSNAKMIISSLERANKKMMEDLRARLQDSNSAIASLLEKSLESEKINSKLRSEIDGLKHQQRHRHRLIGAAGANTSSTSSSHIDEVLDEEPLLAIPPAPAVMELAETID